MALDRFLYPIYHIRARSPYGTCYKGSEYLVISSLSNILVDNLTAAYLGFWYRSYLVNADLLVIELYLIIYKGNCGNPSSFCIQLEWYDGGSILHGRRGGLLWPQYSIPSLLLLYAPRTWLPLWYFLVCSTLGKLLCGLVWSCLGDLRYQLIGYRSTCIRNYLWPSNFQQLESAVFS